MDSRDLEQLLGVEAEAGDHDHRARDHGVAEDRLVLGGELLLELREQLQLLRRARRHRSSDSGQIAPSATHYDRGSERRRTRRVGPEVRFGDTAPMMGT